PSSPTLSPVTPDILLTSRKGCSGIYCKVGSSILIRDLHAYIGLNAMLVLKILHGPTILGLVLSQVPVPSKAVFYTTNARLLSAGPYLDQIILSQNRAISTKNLSLETSERQTRINSRHCVAISLAIRFPRSLSQHALQSSDSDTTVFPIDFNSFLGDTKFQKLLRDEINTWGKQVINSARRLLGYNEDDGSYKSEKDKATRKTRWERKRKGRTG
ncbi:11151_t:CDS:2, partial [Acaulospora colombiana]